MKKYVTFSGRASRSEFWWFVAAVFLLQLILFAATAAVFGPAITVHAIPEQYLDRLRITEFRAAYGLGPTFITQELGPVVNGQAEVVTRTYSGGIPSIILGVAMFLPQLAATWRRLHDTGRPGWWVLLPFAALLVGGLLFVGLELIGLASFFFALLFLGFLVCGIVFLVMLMQAPTPGPNRFGANPAGAS
ncbi:DUF805 domain-containing protein [Jannaschia marina]|uniref:DUF805 domain-containing protein n=1 Tax=Jannaschia marina TaxID=2741674 RepID=UPI0015C70C86|nr:DUF805 domain-containing protein [Jannaschia marina]